MALYSDAPTTVFRLTALLKLDCFVQVDFLLKLDRLFHRPLPKQTEIEVFFVRFGPPIKWLTVFLSSGGISERGA